ncbi:HAD-IA family hydrolase [Blastopirellula marina]|uniref:HAD family hydrolase n=1 Tax=Blastopirellula marina TaxID=124 RepID=A0A2S8G2N8_9BACT|nr:HAD-IA family hydrolase [Blastopirellula marina]PQO38404.1 HAD family hydrolase [Blastopirellula marina]PTL45061.1 HAD family hydrolase [Blastopirellula marina]
MQFEGLIFDLDGTLADTMPAHYLSWREITQKHGLKFSEDRFYSLGGVPTSRIFSLLADEQGVSLDPGACAIEKEETFISYLGEVGPIEPVLDVVRENYGKVPMAVATGAMHWVMERILNQLDIHHYFTAFVSSEDTVRHKPFPDVFLEAARRLGVPAEKCCVYEDAQLGIEAGQAAGMHVVDVRDFHTPRRITAGA